MLRQAYGDEAVGRRQCFEWHRRFQSGRSSLEDDERSGSPSTSIIPENIDKIRHLIDEDRRRSIDDFANMVGVSYGSAQAILILELNMRRTAAKSIPRLLTLEQH